VKIWDTATGRETLTLRGHTDGVHGVHWDPNGYRLATRDEPGNVLVWDATAGYLAERSAATHAGLKERIHRDPGDTVARRTRAEVFARQGDWDAAAADFAELARRTGFEADCYPAGWWVVADPGDHAPPFPLAAGAPARWVAPADDPNGYVSLPADAAVAVTRVYVAQATTVTLEIGPVRPGRLWVNGLALDSAAPGRVELLAGWNLLALAPGNGPRELFVRFRAER
jgi:hypothetical protein